MSARAASLPVSAAHDTIMSAHVLMMIIPSQQQMVAAMALARPPDADRGRQAALRSLHNNYFTLPVLFIMISNHYPMTYGARYGWVALLAIMLLAAYVRHFFNLRHRGRTVWAIPVTALLATLVLAILMAPDKPQATAGGP